MTVVKPWRSVGSDPSSMPSVFSPAEFGGDPTGTVDSTAALQACIDEAHAVHGTVDLGPGGPNTGPTIWKYSSQLVVGDLVGSQINGLRITGGGGGKAAAPRLRWMGDDAALGLGEAALLIDSVQNVEIDHVRFDYSNAGFTRTLVRLNDSTADCININIHDCWFGAATGIASLSADVLLETRHDLIVSVIERCGFNGAANNLLRFGRDGGFTNEVTVRDCSFNDTDNADRGQIQIGGSIQALTIDGCTFEAAEPHNLLPIRGTNGADVGDDTTNLIYEMTVSNCWAGDAGSGGPANGFAKGLNGLADFGPVTFLNNFIDPASPGGIAGPLVTAGDTGCGFLFIGNRAAAGILVGTNDDVDSNYKALFLYNTVGGAEEPTTGNLFALADPPVDWSRVSRVNNYFTGQVAVGADPDFSDVATWQPDTTLMVGGSAPTALLDLPSTVSGAVYTRTLAGSSRGIAIQARGDLATDRVSLVAGTTATEMVHANGNGAAVNGRTPPLTIPTAPAAASAGLGAMSAGYVQAEATAVKDAVNELKTLVNAIRSAQVNFGLYGP